MYAEHCSLESLDGKSSPMFPSSEATQLNNSEINDMVYEYLVTEGYSDAAKLFHQELQDMKSALSLDDGGCIGGVSTRIAEESLENRCQVKQSICDGAILKAMEQIHDEYPELLEEHEDLNFLLVQQQLLELIRSDDKTSFIHFAQEQFGEKDGIKAHNLCELEKTLALLAFKGPEKSLFGHLLHLSHRERVAREVNRSVLTSEHAEPSSLLEDMLKLVTYYEQQLENNSVKFPRMEDVLNVN